MLAYLDLSQPSALQELQSSIECLRLVPVLHRECTHCSSANMAFEGCGTEQEPPIQTHRSNSVCTRLNVHHVAVETTNL